MHPNGSWICATSVVVIIHRHVLLHKVAIIAIVVVMELEVLLLVVHA
jgi:hypothetical protein